MARARKRKETEGEMEAPEPTKVTTVRLPVALWDDVRKLAGSQLRTGNDAVVEALRLWLEEQKRKGA